MKSVVSLPLVSSFPFYCREPTSSTCVTPTLSYCHAHAAFRCLELASIGEQTPAKIAASRLPGLRNPDADQASGRTQAFGTFFPDSALCTLCR